MRVIGGTRRGRPLRAPPGTGTRPTGDRVREAIFDVLVSMVDLSGASVADLFAGSGGLGIEALSRGAGAAVFVDRSAAALGAVRANLTATGLEGPHVRVVRSDVVSWLARAHHFDLALCDPPYAFDDWSELLGRLQAELVVAESDRPIDVPAGWEVTRSKRYGGTLVTVVRRASGDPADARSGPRSTTRGQKGSS